MGNANLWKYCTKADCNEFLVSLQLFGETNLSPEEQITCLYSLSNQVEAHYQAIIIAKRDGSPRKLLAPDPILKRIQKNILVHILEGRACSIYATAYQKGTTILANAKPHIAQKQILKLDIEDFFGSILFSSVCQSAFPSRYFPPAVSTLLTQLCCYHDALPQGAPTSAAISNLVLKPFDDYMGKWCEERHIKYTRYCDDMTFSGDFDGKLVENKVRNFLQEMGFLLNQKKTKLICHDRQQSVTGVIVNEKPQVAKAYRKKIRQEIYYCQKYGVHSHLVQQEDSLYLPFGKAGIDRYLSVLLGKTDFVLQINPVDKEFQQAKVALKKLILTNQEG